MSSYYHFGIFKFSLTLSRLANNTLPIIKCSVWAVLAIFIPYCNSTFRRVPLVHLGFAWLQSPCFFCSTTNIPSKSISRWEIFKILETFSKECQATSQRVVLGSEKLISHLVVGTILLPMGNSLITEGKIIYKWVPLNSGKSVGFP